MTAYIILLLVINLFIDVPFQLPGEHTALQPCREPCFFRHLKNIYWLKLFFFTSIQLTTISGDLQV